MRLALGTNLTIYTSVAKGLKLKVRRFWRPNPTFVEVTGEKLVGSLFIPLPDTLKEFLSHIETKSDLTTYLTEYCGKELKKTDKKFIVVHQTSCVTNNENYLPDLEYHDHEEADTLIMLQAKNVADMYPNCERYILSPDTDVFLLANYIYRKLSPKLVLRTGNARDIRDIDTGKVCNSLSANYTVAILG